MKMVAFFRKTRMTNKKEQRIEAVALRCEGGKKKRESENRAGRAMDRLWCLPHFQTLLTVSQRQVLGQLPENKRERDQRRKIKEEDRHGAPAEAARGPSQRHADEQDVEVGAREHVREGLGVAERGDEARGRGSEGAAAARGGGEVAPAPAEGAAGEPPVGGRGGGGGGHDPRGEVARGGAQRLAEGRGGLLRSRVEW